MQYVDYQKVPATLLVLSRPVDKPAWQSWIPAACKSRDSAMTTLLRLWSWRRSH